MNLNLIEQDGETLMNICKQILYEGKSIEDVREPMETIITRMDRQIIEKRDRLKNLMAAMDGGG